MGDVDMLGKGTAAADRWVREHAGIMVDDGQCEPLARDVLTAAGVLGEHAQPPPEHFPGEPSCHDEIVEYVREHASLNVLPAAEPFVERMLARKAFGERKYGTTLQVSGPRDPLEDLLDELCDAAAYAQQGWARIARAAPYSYGERWWARRRQVAVTEALEAMAMIDATARAGERAY